MACPPQQGACDGTSPSLPHRLQLRMNKCQGSIRRLLALPSIHRGGLVGANSCLQPRQLRGATGKWAMGRQEGGGTSGATRR